MIASRKRRLLVSHLPIVLLGGLSCWAVTSFTASLVLARGNPQMAASAWPSGYALSNLSAKRSDQLLKQPNRAEAARVRELARHALSLNPVSAPAARALSVATTLSGDEANGLKLLRYGETLSRRDVPTQVLMIELAVQAGDIRTALDHYHKAMQTSKRSRELLIPVLAAAANDVAIARELAPILSTRPEYWSDFTGQYTEQASSADSAFILSRALRLNPRLEEERTRLQLILARLIKLQRTDLARTLYGDALGLRAVERSMPVQDPSFEREPWLPPFDWDLQDEQWAAREAQADASGNAALSLIGTNGEDAARQLISLRPGTYRFTARTRDFALDASSGGSVIVTCASNGNSLPLKAASVGNRGHSLTFAFSVPPGCRDQWLIIRSPRFGMPSGQAPWIDDIKLTGIG